jgi:tight adherence protein C
MPAQLAQLQQLLTDPTFWQKPSTLIAVGCGIVCALLVARMLRRRRSAQPAAAPEEPAAPASGGGVFGPLTPALAAQVPVSEMERREFGQMLRQAGMYSPTARASVYAYRFLLMVFPLVVAGILAIASPREQQWKFLVGGAIVAMTLSVVPRLYVYVRRQERLRQINAGLADMLDMLSMCIGGGMALPASLDHVAKNLTNHPALAEELLILKKHTEVHSLKFALADMANRVDTPEVRQVTTLLARGDSLGVSISGNLLDQADHFRNTRKQMATLQANRTPIFLTFPLLFCFAPAVLILLMSPTFLQLGDFFLGKESNNPLANNDRLSTQRIVNTLSELDQRVEQ